MDIHKPKAARNWREFAVEIGTITAGILIALTLEQAVDVMHWRHLAAEAEASMSKELTEDDGPQAYERITQSPCISAQLDVIEHGLVAERDGKAAFKPQPLTTPTFHTWDSDAFRQATASGALSHMRADHAYAWSSPYTLMADMDAANIREAGDYAELAAVGYAPQHPSEAFRERLLAASARARGENMLLTRLAVAFVGYLKEPGVVMTDAQKRQRLQGDGKFPACMTVREA